MSFCVNFADTRVAHVGVDLSCGDVGVAEHFLYGAKVCTVFDKVSRKGMAKGVRRNVGLYACFLCVVFDELPEALTAHRFTGTVDEKSVVFVV